jgi:putative DNA methylase
MSEFMTEVAATQSPHAPATIYYAYKATESKDGEIRSTGWDTFLQAVIDAGMQVTATWPMRTERQGRMVSVGTNALASSIVLACRPREVAAQLATRAEFVAALRGELPEAVRILQSGNIAPVDIPQSTIGPGIGVFSRYARVVESDGSAMSVSAALSIINDVLGEILDGEESEMDRDSRFALAWYSQYGYNPASSGEADSVARAKNTSLQGVVDAGVGETRGGKFRLFERSELAEGWSPLDDSRATVWEATQHLIAALERSETEAAQLLHRLGGYGERARVLAYLLFKKATDKGWAAEAGAYNGLIMAWPTLRATEVGPTAGQQSMDLS